MHTWKTGGRSVGMNRPVCREILVIRKFSVALRKLRKKRALGLSKVGFCGGEGVCGGGVYLSLRKIASYPFMRRNGFILRSFPSYIVTCEIPFSL